MDTAKELLLKEYESASETLLASKSRFFQVEALVLTLVWGGFALFATQTSAGSVEHILTVSAAAAGAAGFSAYWMITANRFRFEEMIIENRLREIEEELGMHLHTDVWLDIQRKPWPMLTPTQRERYAELKSKIPLPLLVLGLGVRTRFPLGMFIGVGGIVLWLALVARAFAVHFGVL